MFEILDSTSSINHHWPLGAVCEKWRTIPILSHRINADSAVFPCSGNIHWSQYPQVVSDTRTLSIWDRSLGTSHVRSEQVTLVTRQTEGWPCSRDNWLWCGFKSWVWLRQLKAIICRNLFVIMGERLHTMRRECTVQIVHAFNCVRSDISSYFWGPVNL